MVRGREKSSNGGASGLISGGVGHGEGYRSGPRGLFLSLVSVVPGGLRFPLLTLLWGRVVIPVVLVAAPRVLSILSPCSLRVSGGCGVAVQWSWLVGAHYTPLLRSRSSFQVMTLASGSPACRGSHHPGSS